MVSLVCTSQPLHSNLKCLALCGVLQATAYFQKQYVQPEKYSTAVFSLVVQKSRRESAHARTFGGDFELKFLRMRRFLLRILDNQPENFCIWMCCNLYISVDCVMRLSSNTVLSSSLYIRTQHGCPMNRAVNEPQLL